MRRSTRLLLASTVVLALVMSAGPTLVHLAQAAVPLVIALGAVAVVVRLVWYLTNRY